MAESESGRNAPEGQSITCAGCGEVKAIGLFYASNQANCKECVKERVRRRARLNPAVREYERERSKTPKRREHIAETARKWNEKNPQAYTAHYLLSNAVRDKRISREPCLFCGETRVHAHHRDYSKPLEVIWLCPKCHHRLHKYFPETEAQGKGDAG